MASKARYKTTYEAEHVIQPIYTGGDVALDSEGRLLATCSGEEALLTDLCTGKLLARIEGDSEVLTALALTPSGSHLIACSRSLSMQVHALRRLDDSDLLSPTLLRTLKPHTTPVITVAVDITGTLFATGAADGVVKVWDIRDGYVTHTFRGHGGVISALHFFEALHSDSGSQSKQHRKKRSRSNLRDDDYGLVNGHSSTSLFRLASGSEDGKIRIWDLDRRKAIATLDSHNSVIRGLQYSKEMNTLVSGSRDKTVITWDASSWKLTKAIPILEGVEAVEFLEEGTFFYTGGENGRLRVWHTKSGAEITKEQQVGNEGDGILQVIRNDASQFLLSVHADQSLVLHSSSVLSTIGSISASLDPLPILRRISGTHDEIIDLAYITPDRSLLALATNSENIRLVSLATSTSETSSPLESNYFGADVALLQGHEDIIICISVDWSGCWLATGAKDNTARLWKLDHASKSYQHCSTFTGHAESIGAISLKSTPPTDSAEKADPLNHPPAFLLTGSQDRTIKRWNILKSTSSEQCISRLQAKALYTRKAHDKDINSIALSPNSNLYASASQDRTVRIWSTEEGEVQGILRGHRRGVWSVAFAPKDTPSISSESGPASSSRGLVLTGSGDKTVKIWSLNDYTCLRTFEGHTNSVLKVLWLPSPPPPPTSNNDDDSASKPSKRPPQVASAGGDGLLKIWDASSGECSTTLDNHTDRIWALTVNPQTGTLVSGGGDSVVTFWKDTSIETAAKTTAAATQRVEQDQELQNYIHRGSYREAITLALALNHPARLLSLFTSVINTPTPEPTSITGLLAVDDIIGTLSDEQLLSLLSRVRDWNTNARTSPVAQRVLNVVVRRYPAGRLAGLGRRRGGKEVVEALRVYTERHYRRVEELWGESWLVECLLGEMEQLGVEGVEDGIGEDVEMEVERNVVVG